MYLLDALKTFKSQLCSEQRDKVFGLLGFVRFGHQFVVDYTVTSIQLFERILAHCVLDAKHISYFKQEFFAADDIDVAMSAADVQLYSSQNNHPWFTRSRGQALKDLNSGSPSKTFPCVMRTMSRVVSSLDAVGKRYYIREDQNGSDYIHFHFSEHTSEEYETIQSTHSVDINFPESLLSAIWEIEQDDVRFGIAFDQHDKLIGIFHYVPSENNSRWSEFQPTAQSAPARIQSVDAHITPADICAQWVYRIKLLPVTPGQSDRDRSIVCTMTAEQIVGHRQYCHSWGRDVMVNSFNYKKNVKLRQYAGDAVSMP